MAEPAPLTGAVRLPDGALVRGRALRRPLPPGPLPEFGLYLGRRAVDVGWAAERIDWPDFRVPGDGDEAVARIVAAHGLARVGRRVEVACGGGTGRTGTVLACMAVVAGVPAAEAVAWTRRHYRPRAVETRGQRRWVRWFAERVGA